MRGNPSVSERTHGTERRARRERKRGHHKGTKQPRPLPHGVFVPWWFTGTDVRSRQGGLAQDCPAMAGRRYTVGATELPWESRARKPHATTGEEGGILIFLSALSPRNAG